MKRNNPGSARRTRLLVGLLVTVLIAAFFRHQLTRPLAVQLFLKAQSPREEGFHDLVMGERDPGPFLVRCWSTGKIAHRQLVAGYLSARAMTNAPWSATDQALLLAGVLDSDISVRELALAALEARKDPCLFECAQAQLADPDPLVRLLGVEYLRKTDPQSALPVAIRLLDDPDLRVVTAAEIALLRWSGVDFGVRTRLAIPDQDKANADVAPAQVETIKQGVARRKDWWRLHAKEYHPTAQAGAACKLSQSTRPVTSDFILPDINGNSIRLSSLRGKIVLLNFWATWCTACLAEIPDLIALQNKLGDRVAIIGVALDGVPDEDDDSGTHQAESATGAGSSTKRATRTQVERAVKARGINYTVLLDPTSSVGGRFNGGELPTTVLIDAEGRVRRRFIGARNLKVFEAMIAQAAQPVVPVLASGDTHHDAQ